MKIVRKFWFRCVCCEHKWQQTNPVFPTDYAPECPKCHGPAVTEKVENIKVRFTMVENYGEE